MKIVKDPFEYISSCRTAVTIGKFDGVHLGHRKLIEETVRQAEKLQSEGISCSSLVFTFDMTSTMVFSKKERRAILEEMGVDVLVECSFGPKMITMEAEDFVKNILVGNFRAGDVYSGEDFRFGYRRAGDDALLVKMGAELGFSVHIIPDVLLDGRRISSTDVRGSLLAGDMEKVRAMLGMPFYVKGRIIHGRAIGRTIGVPTANMIPDKSKLLPPNGVYFTETPIGGVIRRGITNIGTKPTVDGHFIGVETWYFDFGEDLYDEELCVKLLHFSRPEQKFDSLDELKDRIMKDREEGTEFFSYLPLDT